MSAITFTCANNLFGTKDREDRLLGSTGELPPSLISAPVKDSSSDSRTMRLIGSPVRETFREDAQQFFGKRTVKCITHMAEL